MPYVDGFEYDLFISYAHVNNQHGWVQAFHDDLCAGLNEVLGRKDASRVFFDARELPPAKRVTPHIRKTVSQSAVLLLVGSTGYLESDWCRQEREIFLESIGDDEAADGRIYLVLYDELPLKQRPDPLHELVGFAFFEDRDGVPTTLERDDKSYKHELNKLRRDLADQFRLMAGKSEVSSAPQPARIAPPVERPPINYTDEAAKLIAHQLREKQKARLLLTDENAKHAGPAKLPAIEAEILDLKRQLRDGPQLVPGDWLGHRYELIKRLGSGGFATVWQAFDEHAHQLVAVKVLHGQFSDSTERRHRFRRGAQVMQRLTHPHIVPVLQPMTEDSGRWYFVMEYMSGGTLLDAACEMQLTPDQLIQAVVQTGEALAYAHRRGAIHRDVTPDNILLDANGAARLTDFDLVRMDGSTGGTRTVAGMGKYMYAAPECHESAKHVDQRADVYSLAMTLIVCLARKKQPPRALLRRPHEVVNRLPCEDALQAVLLKAIEEEPDDRYGSVDEFLGAVCTDSTTDFPVRRQRSGSQPDRVGGDKAAPKIKVTKAVKSTDSEVRRTDILASIINPKDGSELILIPAGEFLMGSNEHEDNEQPQHQVTLPDFYIAKHLVTNAQYRRFMEDTNHKQPYLWDNSTYNQDQQPVVGVTWHDALAYCEWAGGRLPTESEWEKAARGTDGRLWPWGNEQPTDKLANFGNKVNAPTEVGAYPDGASPYGCLDMAGNVWEWCVTKWWPSYKETEDNRPNDDATRVLRGGAYYSGSSGVRCGSRDRDLPRYWNFFRGFRFAQALSSFSDS